VERGAVAALAETASSTRISAGPIKTMIRKSLNGCLCYDSCHRLDHKCRR
jgi:hypothetical protein